MTSYMQGRTENNHHETGRVATMFKRKENQSVSRLVFIYILVAETGVSGDEAVLAVFVLDLLLLLFHFLLLSSLLLTVSLYEGRWGLAQHITLNWLGTS